MPSHKTKEITAAEFFQIFGYEPEQDDLERVNCEKAGEVGHYSCGWCPEHGVPNLKCGCWRRKEGFECQHEPDPTSLSIPMKDLPPHIDKDGDVTFVVDINCRKCGVSGSFSVSVDPIDINW